MLAGKRAFTAVLAVSGLIAIVVAVLLDVEVSAPGGADREVLGHREVVAVTVPDDGASTAQRTAAVAPSIDRTSISLELARELGIPLDEAATVTVVSAFGRQQRPAVEVDVTVGARTSRVLASVAQRGLLEDDVLLGRDAIGDALVDPSRVLLQAPDGAAGALGFALQDTLLGRNDPLPASALLALLPVGAMVIVVLRYVVGVRTLGTFAPILVAVAFLQAGIAPAAVIIAAIIALGLLVEPLLGWLKLPRVARLGLLVGLAALALVVLAAVLGSGSSVARWGAAFPLVVAAGLVEQLWSVLEVDGPGPAVVDAGGTLLVALLTVPVLLAEPVRALGRSAPWAVVLVAMALTVLAGSYRGLRLTELVRFRGAARRHGAPV